MNKYIAMAGVVAVWVSIFSPRPVHAAEVCFCHNIEHNPITICTDNNGLINGHMGHVEEGNDILSRCEDIPHAPEFGTVSAAVAAVMSGGVFLGLKRKLGIG